MRPRAATRPGPPAASVFDAVTELARRYDAINLGSAGTDRSVPHPLKTAAAQAIAADHNRYAPVRGEPSLRAAVAAHAARFHGQAVDPATEVAVTAGVTEGLHAALVGLVDPGDEVVVFEPFYDCYVPAVRMAGATPVAVPLRGPQFRFDPGELRAAFSRRTRAILVNTPHNPTGTVFSRDELALIADLCQEFDALAFTDEVYEHFVFDGARHIRLATLPGMWDRTLTLGGAGKTFACPGWRIGWAIGPAALQEALDRVRPFTVFAAPTPFQFAVAAALRLPDGYFRGLAVDYQRRRDVLFDALAAGGLRPTRPAGGFFILADLSARASADGAQFCSELARDVGVAPLPLNTFYLDPESARRVVRFTFAVREEALETAAARLSKLDSGRRTG